MEHLLQGSGRCLKEIDQRGQCSKGDRQEKYDQDDESAGNAGQHVRQENKHQTRATLIQLLSCHRHSRDNNQGGQHGGQGIKDSHHTSIRGNIGVLAQIGAINQSSISRHRQGEKRLSQGIDPNQRI